MALVPFGAGYSSRSSSSTRRWKWKYDVFLSFRGEDTRTSFTDHLYATLQRKGIITFRDNEGLKKGQFIKQILLQAIGESFCAIVVLSQNYASSSWCLDELLKILDSSKKEFGLQVFPVFYEVDPCDVRHQKGNFAEAFRKHEERFTQDKVKKWKDALREVANLSGWHSKNQHEAELIESIAQQVWSKLLYRRSPDFNLVGFRSQIMSLYTLIAKGLDDVRFIGIWGMGGIGKTTLARFVYERIKEDFEICCFLADVRDVCEREGLVHLQRKLISHFNLTIKINDDLYEGSMLIKHFLCNKKVLLVLDDVSNINQLENLAAMQEWFGLGSRVIITTREVHLLTSHGVFATYEMETLGYFDSLELFFQKAFRGSQPEEEYFELSRTIIRYANGLPLALKVLGLFLHGKTVHQWKDAINMLSTVVPKDILNVLKLSYDELEENEKTIFLNIACFFKGMAKDEVTQILGNCGLFAEIGIKVLIDKSLVTINSEGHLSMHDMLQEMGRNIVFQESPNDVGKRSRLWSWEDINHVLAKKKGTEKIQWIVLKSFVPREAHWDPEAYLNMCDLKLLIISGELNIRRNLICFPRGLKVLQWDKYNLDSLPIGVQFDELVDFKMQHSKIKQLWIETQKLEMLKFLDLSHCIDLIKTPDFDGIPNLERLILQGCKSLVEVHHSLAQLNKLKIVNLKDCASLKTLPGNELEMNCLETFILSGCSKIRKLPEFGETMEFLSTLDLADTSIVKLPESIAYLTSLAVLNLRNCKNLVCLPRVIQNLKSLETINLSGCSKCESFPINWNENKGVKELDVSGTAIKEVPSSIFHLENLQFLSFMGCKQLILPNFRPCLPLLKHLNLSFCNLNDESLPRDLSSLSSLKELELRGNNFVNLPARFISNLLKLKYLSMEHCPRLQSLPQLPPNIRSTAANDTASMEPLIDTEKLWDLFASLNLQHCRKPLEDHIKFIIPGSEIPSWFHNQNDLRCLFPKHWKIALSLEDIPYYCRSSEWWGIAICVVVHGDSTIVPKLSHDYLNLSASLPQHANSIVTLNFNLGEQYYSSDRLVILYAPCSHEIARSVEFGLGIYTSLVGAQDFSHEFEITKSGWRALCKEDIEAWRRAPKQNSNHGLFDLNVRPSVGDSEHATLLPPSPSSRSRAGRKRKTMFNFL